MRTGDFKPFTFYSPTKIVHGPCSVQEAARECRMLGITKAGIVTDIGVRNAGLIDGIVESLKTGNISFAVFDDVEQDPNTMTVARGAEFVLKEKCDGLIAVGGGSSICAGRGIGVIARNGGAIRDYVGLNKASKPPLPLIAVPTTAGSGAEVSQIIILKDQDRHSKIVVGSPLYFPKVAILDPMLLRTLSFGQFVISGVDALTHAIEACLTTMTTPITDSIALFAVHLIYSNLRAAASSDDLEAKEACLIGSSMANMACGNARLGLVHAIAQPVEGMFSIPHGVAIGVFLPHIMEHNLLAGRERFITLARYMGESENAGSPQKKLGFAAIRAVKRLLADLRFPRKFSEPEVDRQAIPQMTKMIMGGLYGGDYDSSKELAMNAVVPIPNIRKTTVKEVFELYERAFEGWELE
jgi:alcohol dehydrogenase class IV